MSYKKECGCLSQYYFITYQAKNRQGSISVWNQVIDISPMEFIKHVEEVEVKSSNTYYNFVVMNTCKIQKDEFDKYKDCF
jgi:hypothetical protein